MRPRRSSIQPQSAMYMPSRMKTGRLGWMPWVLGWPWGRSVKRSAIPIVTELKRKQNRCRLGGARNPKQNARYDQQQSHSKPANTRLGDCKKRRQPARRKSPHHRHDESPSKQYQVLLVERVRKRSEAALHGQSNALDKIEDDSGREPCSADQNGDHPEFHRRLRLASVTRFRQLVMRGGV